MEDKNKTKEQLMGELEKSRCRIAELEALETKRVEGELRMKAAFDVVRSSLHEMRESGDMKNVLASVYEALKEIGIDFENCSIQIVDEKFKGFGILWRGLYQGQQKLHFMGSDREYPASRTLVINNAVYEAWQNKRPIYRRDLKAEDPYDELADIKKSYSVDIRSILDVPFSHGTIAINSMQPNAFSETDIQMLKQFAEILSEAHSWLENITERERAEETARIQRDLGMILSVTDSLEEILRLCVEAAINGTEMDCGGIYLVDKVSGALDLAFQKGLSPEFVKNASHYDTDSLNARLVMAGEPVYAKYETMDVNIGEPDHREELRATAIIPVYHEGQAIACLNIASHTLDDVPTAARHMLETIAAQIGSVIVRIQAEKELQESEEKYRVLVENASEAILVTQDGMFKFANPKTVEITGYSEEELTSRPFLDFVHPDDREMVAERYLKRLRGEEISNIYSFRIIDGDGNTKWVDINAVLMDWMGKPATLNFLADITERKEAEEALRESEEKYKGLFDNSMDAIYIHDMEGRFLDANQAALDMLGYTKEEISGLSIVSIIDEDQLPRALNSIKDLLAGKHHMQEYVMTGKNGRTVNVEVLGSVVYDRDGKPSAIQGIARDISERKQLERELLRIEKLESVGILAGGIAHDFNNILTAILGNISLARMYTDPDKISERLAEAEKASIRAGSLTQQLLTFSRGGAPIKTISSIAGILKDSTAFALSGSNVKFEFSVPDDLWAVEIDEGQISQVINNLIINADQAMPGGGTIKVQTENVTVGVEDILPLEAGEYVRISIKDQGIGMSEELLRKIFDPYVTTKQKGSGLGLATCYSIISNHDGYITAESQLGIGSTFHIYLPASPEEILLKNEEAEEKPIIGKGRILVIDDDDMIRELVSDMLENIGYEAALAIDGAQAIEIYRNARESGYPFDAVIVDLTIPGGMGGKEAIQKLKEIDPEIKAVVSSGYSTDPIMANFREYGFSDVIAKPYRSKELSEVLYRVTNDK